MYITVNQNVHDKSVNVAFISFFRNKNANITRMKYELLF